MQRNLDILNEAVDPPDQLHDGLCLNKLKKVPEKLTDFQCQGSDQRDGGSPSVLGGEDGELGASILYWL